MTLSIVGRYRAVTLTASSATRTEYCEGTTIMRAHYQALTCVLLASTFICLTGCSNRRSVVAPEASPWTAGSFRVTMDDAIRLLGTEPTGPNPETSTGSYRLQFNGFVTTMSGVTRQNLQETLEPAASVTISSATANPGSAFLQLLRLARPDLARKMSLLAPSIATQSAATLFRPTLLHGYAWEQTDQWIGTYGDLNQQIAWIFLTPALRPGSEFSLQLVPDLADDVFLHARVLGWKNVETSIEPREQ